MKKYSNPKAELVALEAKDVITLSVLGDSENKDSIIYVDLGDH